MKTAKIHTLIFMLVLAFPLLAQEKPNTLPDLQTADYEFFDPTRKEKVEYKFSTAWRLEAGYTQRDQKQDTSSLYLHGVRLGATVDFNLPYNFSVQTGAIASVCYGVDNQHYALVDKESAQAHFVQNNIIQTQLVIPARVYYNITLWKKLRMFFFAGPQLNIGLSSYDVVRNYMSESVTEWAEQQGIKLHNHDRYADKQLYRTNLQFGLGGGFEWDRYRLQSGYDFGLHNVLRQPVVEGHKMQEWSWLLTFSYAL